MKRAAALVLPLAMLASACHSEDPARPAAQKSAGAPAFLTVTSRQLSQLELVRVQPTTWTADTRTTGTVDWDGDHTTQAITQVSGPIARIVVDLGARVKAGDPLLLVRSPDFANAVSAYRVAANRLDLARRTLERNKDLLEHKVIAQKDLEISQADYNDAYTAVQNDLQALRIFGVSGADLEAAERQNVPIAAELAVRAPIAGVVVQKMVMPGQLVQAGTTTCFVISDTKTVWVQGHLHEDDLTSVRVGDQVEVRRQASPTPLRGVVGYVGALLDPATRTTPVRIVTANPNGLLKKDEFVEVSIRTSARRDVLAVPASAVLYSSDNLPFVYQQVAPGRFARAVVSLGARNGNEFELLSGLHEGDTIVAQGAVFLQFAETSER